MPLPCAAISADRDLVDDRRRLADVERPGAAQARAQRLAFEQIHQVVVAAVGQRAEVEDVDDVRMADLVDRARLGHEPLDRRGLVRELGLQHLDRRALADQRMRRRVDDAHAAGAEHVLDDIAADVRARRELLAFDRGRLFVGEAGVQSQPIVGVACHAPRL